MIFPAGATKTTVIVELVDDNIIEETEHFFMSLHNPVLGSVNPMSASVTAFITDNDSKMKIWTLLYANVYSSFLLIKMHEDVVSPCHLSSQYNSIMCALENPWTQ